MRHLLHAMIKIYEHNKSHRDGIVIEHSTVTIMYQAYEACLKNWYQEVYDPVVEQKFRLDLMDELLFDNSWTYLDVEQLIDSSWIMVDRDEQGWMKPSRSLPYPEEEQFVSYQTINGAEINEKTGEINFFMTPWTRSRPVYEKLFTSFDLQQMLEKNLGGAIFSLDPADPDKPYHPFNLMRFSPSTLFESELLNTMLLTDYVLKFLTTNQEVQGCYPFEQRPVAPMIKHLPEYLRQIIIDFQDTQHSEALHRFWIEAETIDISTSEAEKNKEGITRIGVGNLKMIVKKHRMEQDIHGELKDVGNEDEGWPIYVLSPEQMSELEQGKRVINNHAMIFIYAQKKLFYWEHNKLIKAHIPEDCRETLLRLYKQPKDKDGKLIQSTGNMPLIYRATKEMARQSGLSHRYSPEFIFAHEFTTHYDEFAQYLPEFGRLKELSKMSTLIGVLNNLRQSNKKAVQALEFLLNPPSTLSEPDTNTYKYYHQYYEELRQAIISDFQGWRQRLATSVLQQEWGVKLNKIKLEMGSLTCSARELDDACDRWYNQISRDNPRASYSTIWEAINPKKAQIAKDITAAKRSNCNQQLRTIFYPLLSNSMHSYEMSCAISSFMDGDGKPLLNALVSQERAKAVADIHKLFPKNSTSDISKAIDDKGENTAQHIATNESRNKLMEQKKLKDAHESGFVAINLGIDEAPVDQKGTCFWVPASVRHDVKTDKNTGQTRYSFFVYGGVTIQPRINIVQGNNGRLGGNSVGGGTFNKKTGTVQGFQGHHIVSPTNKATKNHELLQLAGFNNKSDMNSRQNIILLPKDRTQHPVRSVHNGRHTQSAMDTMAGKMDIIVEQGKSKNWSQSQYREALRKMLSESRQDLRSGKTDLYVKPMSSPKSK